LLARNLKSVLAFTLAVLISLSATFALTQFHNRLVVSGGRMEILHATEHWSFNNDG
jgi:hypothetical protein